MRPCNNCGDPIENRLLYCENCKGVAPKTPHDEARQLRDTTPTRKELFGLIAEIAIRTAIIACPVTVVLGFLLMLALPVVAAFVIAAFVGMVGGLGWTMLEMYFQSGSH